MKLVLVHGRSQGGKDPVGLEKEWLAALDEGLVRAGKTLPAGTQVEFPFYGDVLDALIADLDVPLQSTIAARGGPDDDDSEDLLLQKAILDDMARAAGVSQADIERELAQGVRERGPLNWEWVQAILRAVDRIPGINSKIIEMITRDVQVYLTYPAVRTKIDAIVAKSIPNEPCVIVAHSLGTVITYNLLRKRAKTPSFPRLITVGSPLGVRAIQMHLDKPLTSPGCIGHWYNALDERDVVALRLLSPEVFPVNPAVENFANVRNKTDNRHGIAGYLDDPDVAGKIVELLE